MGTCENQLFPPTDFPTRPAYLKFKNLKSGLSYCQYGVLKEDGKPIDCEDVPADVVSGAESTDEQKEKYRPQVLAKCVCTPGTECKSVIANAGVASVASTIFVRVALGTLLERFGPVNVQCGLMSFGAFWVAMAAAITAPWNYTLIRFFIGCAGATFVTNQFWCSLMFAPNVVGTANATAAGWGNLGGGVTQVFMMSVLFNPMVASGLEPNVAWRVSMVVPAVMFVVCAVCMKLMCWDMPTARNYDPAVTGKTQKPSMWDYVEVLRDVRVVVMISAGNAPVLRRTVLRSLLTCCPGALVGLGALEAAFINPTLVMIFQYSACFGTELAMNNQLATHFRTYFQMDAGDASALAGAFGLMNLFARSLGGISSDVCFKYFGFRGRIWAQFLALFFEAIFLFSFGNVDNSQPWYVALAVLVCFSLFVQMAEGTSYGIVPFMNRKQLAVVSALVGAGGNLGAVIAGFCFYKPIQDALLPFQVHAGYVMFWALLSPCYYWSEMGGSAQAIRLPAVRIGPVSDNRCERDSYTRVMAPTSGGVWAAFSFDGWEMQMPSLAEICLRMCEPYGARARPGGVHSCLPEAEAAGTGGEVVHSLTPDANACAFRVGGQVAHYGTGWSKRRGRLLQSVHSGMGKSKRRGRAWMDTSSLFTLLATISLAALSSASLVELLPVDIEAEGTRVPHEWFNTAEGTQRPQQIEVSAEGVMCGDLGGHCMMGVAPNGAPGWRNSWTMAISTPALSLLVAGSCLGVFYMKGVVPAAVDGRPSESFVLRVVAGGSGLGDFSLGFRVLRVVRLRFRSQVVVTVALMGLVPAVYVATVEHLAMALALFLVTLLAVNVGLRFVQRFSLTRGKDFPTPKVLGMAIEAPCTAKKDSVVLRAMTRRGLVGQWDEVSKGPGKALRTWLMRIDSKLSPSLRDSWGWELIGKDDCKGLVRVDKASALAFIKHSGSLAGGCRWFFEPLRWEAPLLDVPPVVDWIEATSLSAAATQAVEKAKRTGFGVVLGRRQVGVRKARDSKNEQSTQRRRLWKFLGASFEMGADDIRSLAEKAGFLDVELVEQFKWRSAVGWALRATRADDFSHMALQVQNRTIQASCQFGRGDRRLHTAIAPEKRVLFSSGLAPKVAQVPSGLFQTKAGCGPPVELQGAATPSEEMKEEGGDAHKRPGGSSNGSVAKKLKVQETAVPAGLEPVPNTGQGNCLFLALSDAFGLIGQSRGQAVLRASAVAHLRKYRDAYVGVWDKRTPDEHETEMDDFERYLDSVALEGAWGSALEITAVANTLDVMIRVALRGQVMREVDWGNMLEGPRVGLRAGAGGESLQHAGQGLVAAPKETERIAIVKLKRRDAAKGKTLRKGVLRRILSWNLGSLHTQGDGLAELLLRHSVDVALIQEHHIPENGRHRLSRVFRQAGWQVFWGPQRSCGYGEAVLVHRRFSAALLQSDSREICTVALRMAGGRMMRVASIYAPVHSRGTQEAFFAELASWQGRPGLWVAGGDFNSDLLSQVPCSGHAALPLTNTWRRSVQHEWCSSLDGFVTCGALRPVGAVAALQEEVVTQHAPVICTVPGEIREEFLLAWALPRTRLNPWTLDADEAFFVETVIKSSPPWVRCGACVRGAVNGAGPHELHEKYEAGQAALHALLAHRRRDGINDWKARVRDLSLASKWVKSGPAKPFRLLNEDGSIAITPSEQGRAVKAEWLPRWTERSPAAVAAGVSAAGVFAEALTARASEFPRPPPWTVGDIRAQIRNSAAGLDGLTFQHYRDLPDVHLERLAALYTELDAGMQFPRAWQAARLVCIPKESGDARPLTVMQVGYRLWSARSASLLGQWASSWMPPELIGGRGGAPPAVHSANEVSSVLAVAYHEQRPLTGASLDTEKCFDSVSLESVRCLLRQARAPLFMFRVVDLWERLERHVWLLDGPTGITIRAARQRGLPQGDPLAPWALNLVMATWIWALPKLDLVRVFLDDRCLLHRRVEVLAEGLRITRAFDEAFGLTVHPRKSCRFYVGEAQEDPTHYWSCLPLKVSVKYLGVQLETDPGGSLSNGDARAEAVRAKVVRARLLPQPEVRRTLVASYLQGLYAEGVMMTQLACDRLTTSVVQAWWGPTLNSRNYMRSEAYTLGLLAPLHRMAPVMVQCWSTVVALARLLVQNTLLGQGIWRACFQERRCIGFARQVRRCLLFLKWQWASWDTLIDSFCHRLHLPDLALRNARGDKAKHIFRDRLRAFWWQYWDSSRIAHGGILSGVDRERSLQPLQALRLRKGTFGWDGTDAGARYARFLADALWSRNRRRHAGKVESARCCRCGVEDERTDHFLWGCVANREAQIVLRRDWDAAAGSSSWPAEWLPDALPQCLRQCGVVPQVSGRDEAPWTDGQLAALQRYFASWREEFFFVLAVVAYERVAHSFFLSSEMGGMFHGPAQSSEKGKTQSGEYQSHTGTDEFRQSRRLATAVNPKLEELDLEYPWQVSELAILWNQPCF
ncbi:NRT2.5 [Symbiodinium sp. CCMP2592]|nr:NRT2.5 [Symbiodinium sp. CCMP2592]